MDYNKIAQELIEKKYADDGMIAWGKLGSKKDFTTAGVEGANSWRYAITKVGDDLMFIPFSRSGVYFKNLYVINKAKIKSLKIRQSGFRKFLRMETVDGFNKDYRIIRDVKSLEQIIKSF